MSVTVPSRLLNSPSITTRPMSPRLQAPELGTSAKLRPHWASTIGDEGSAIGLPPEDRLGSNPVGLSSSRQWLEAGANGSFGTTMLNRRAGYQAFVATPAGRPLTGSPGRS